MTFSLNVFLTCIISCDAGPSYDWNCLQVQQINSFHGYHICLPTCFSGDVVGLLPESYTLVQRNSYVSCNQRVVMHVPIVEERRNVLRRKNTPANRRNTRNGYRSRICLYNRIFLKNFGSKPFSMMDCRIKGVIIPAPQTVSHSLYKIFSFTA